MHKLHNCIPRRLLLDNAHMRSIKIQHLKATQHFEVSEPEQNVFLVFSMCKCLMHVTVRVLHV